MLYIFDMGGVLLKNVFALGDILKAHGYDLNMLDLYKDDIMDKFSSGKITEEEYWPLFNEKNGTNIKSPQWGKYFNPELDLEVEKLIIELRVNNRVVCGSNNMDEHYNISVARGDFKCFDKVYVSQKMGVSKPNKKFWEIILEEEKYNANDVVFIDDFKENVLAAESLGINAILYKDIETLKTSISVIH